MGKETNVRVISLRGAVKGIADKEHGKLSNYISAQVLSKYIEQSILEEAIEFNIPGTQLKGSGISAEAFMKICQAYVRAFADGALQTDRQREIAIKCSVLASAFALTGLIALIDEATGYQYEREYDALQVKSRAYISNEIRE